MSYNFPYTILRQDVKELEVGFYIKVGDQFGVIQSKRPFRVIRDETCDASSTLTVQFLDTDSNTTATSGTKTYKGFVGSTTKKPRTIVQIKYIAFTTATPVTIKWGRDPYPLYADVTFSSKTAPAGYVQAGNVGASPIFFNKYSIDSSRYLQVEIDNSTGSSSVAQGIVLECVEYEYEIDERIVQPPRVYDFVNSLGDLQHMET